MPVLKSVCSSSSLLGGREGERQAINISTLFPSAVE